jgi:hypothetical protein
MHTQYILSYTFNKRASHSRIMHLLPARIFYTGGRLADVCMYVHTSYNGVHLKGVCLPADVNTYKHKYLVPMYVL